MHYKAVRLACYHYSPRAGVASIGAGTGESDGFLFIVKAGSCDQPLPENFDYKINL
jgi:hypothetical protein